MFFFFAKSNVINSKKSLSFFLWMCNYIFAVFSICDVSSGFFIYNDIDMLMVMVMVLKRISDFKIWKNVFISFWMDPNWIIRRSNSHNATHTSISDIFIIFLLLRIKLWNVHYHQSAKNFLFTFCMYQRHLNDMFIYTSRPYYLLIVLLHPN